MSRSLQHPPPVLVRVVRDDFVESVHRGHVALSDANGRLLAELGQPDLHIYARSCVKPFQAAAVLDLLGPAADELDDASLAVACASHTGADDHVIEAARLLALAGLDEESLACPPALPADQAALAAATRQARIAFNCSGKHAAFLLAQTAVGAEPASYLQVGSPIQQAVRSRLERLHPSLGGPGVDGCGAPAWRLPLSALARGFAQLADPGSPDPVLRRIATAMHHRPGLVGGAGADDTALMLSGGIVAKRGAEAVFAAGAVAPGGEAVGVAVKVADGGSRAAGPVAAVVLAALGLRVPSELVAPEVLGGGRPHGCLAVDPAVPGVVAGAADRRA